MNRRSAVRLGTTVATAAVCGWPAALRAQSRTIRIVLAPIDNNALPFFAQEMGFFKRAELDVRIEQMQSGAAMSAAVAGGAADIASSNIAQLAQAHMRQIPFTVVAPAGLYRPDAATTVLMAPLRSPLRSARDLSEKTVAVTGLKSISQYAPMMWIDKNGGDSKTAKFIEVPVQEMADAMAQGRVDTAVVQEPFVAAARGNARIFADVFGAIGSRYLISAYFSTTTWTNANPDLVRRFQSVMRETAIWANANHAKTADILVNTLHVDGALVPKMTRAIFGESLDAAQLQPVIDCASRYGGVTAFPANELIYKTVGRARPA